MRVLIACERSGIVRRAFRERGHDAWSCDLVPADDGSKWHIEGDALEQLAGGWDLLIAHPVCRYLTNAGVRWFKTDPERWGHMQRGAEFFRRFWECSIPRIAVENPIMHRYAVEAIGGRRQDQVVQPWMHSHPERKGVGLWLKNLPRLTPTRNVKAEMLKLSKAEQNRIHHIPPGPDRERLRSVFFPGIAAAMAEQWGTP